MGLKDYPSERDQHIVRTFEGVTRSCERIALAKQHNQRTTLANPLVDEMARIREFLRDEGVDPNQDTYDMVVNYGTRLDNQAAEAREARLWMILRMAGVPMPEGTTVEEAVRTLISERDILLKQVEGRE